MVGPTSLRSLCLVPFALIALLWPASAQPRTLAELAAYQGADRTQLLIEGAKKEGTVSYYTSLVASDTKTVVEAFKKKYGIEVEVWRGSTEAIVQRALNEHRAGRCPADAFHSGPPALEPLHREGLLQAVTSPATALVMPQALQPHGEYVGVYLNLFAAAYNTNLVKADEVPKSYEDLKDPRWKGRLAIEADDLPWFAAIVSKLGEDKGLALFRDIVRSTASRRARATRSLPTWSPPARCRWRSRCSATSPSSCSAPARRSALSTCRP